MKTEKKWEKITKLRKTKRQEKKEHRARELTRRKRFMSGYNRSVKNRIEKGEKEKAKE